MEGEFGEESAGDSYHGPAGWWAVAGPILAHSPVDTLLISIKL